MKYDIFISYSRKDLDFATKVCDVLNRYARYYSFRYFFDKEEIKSRNEYLKRISSAIDGSTLILFLASKNSFSSEFCSKELNFAYNHKVRIHQYRIDSSTPPYDIELLLGNYQYLEASTTPIEAVVQEVLSDVLDCDIAPILELEEQDRRRNGVGRAQLDAKQQKLRDIMAALEQRRRALDEEIAAGKKRSNVRFDNTSDKVESDTHSSKGSNGSWNLFWRCVKKAIKFMLIFIFVVITLVLVDWLFSDKYRDRVTSAPYKVGDYYNENGKQGVVFDVYNSGYNGKIVSLDEEKLKWSTITDCIGVASTTDGRANTDQVMARSNANKFSAFVWCRDHGEDWYLPSVEELENIFEEYYTINITLDKIEFAKKLQIDDDFKYWSSNESSNEQFSALFFGEYGGHKRCYESGDKTDRHHVRAVSTF